jgi:putative transposase
MRIFDRQTGKSYFEKRRRRYNEPGQPRELTFSCYRRYAFFARQRTCAWFGQALQAARARFGFQIWACVLMPDHVHLLVDPGQAAHEMSGFLQAVKQPVARQAIESLTVHSPAWLTRLTVREGRRVRHRLWQPGGGYDRNITSLETLRAMIDYMHANPVRRGLAADILDWEWSSARWYAGIRPVKIQMDAQVLMELARGKLWRIGTPSGLGTPSEYRGTCHPARTPRRNTATRAPPGSR